jgi:hypothetical protein
MNRQRLKGETAQDKLGRVLGFLHGSDVTVHIRSIISIQDSGVLLRGDSVFFTKQITL